MTTSVKTKNELFNKVFVNQFLFEKLLNISGHHGQFYLIYIWLNSVLSFTKTSFSGHLIPSFLFLSVFKRDTTRNARQRMPASKIHLPLILFFALTRLRPIHLLLSSSVHSSHFAGATRRDPERRSSSQYKNRTGADHTIKEQRRRPTYYATRTHVSLPQLTSASHRSINKTHRTYPIRRDAWRCVPVFFCW